MRLCGFSTIHSFIIEKTGDYFVKGKVTNMRGSYIWIYKVTLITNQSEDRME